MPFPWRRQDEELLKTFKSFTQQISSIQDLKQLLKNLLKSLAEIAQVKSGCILLFENEIKACVVRESLGGEPLLSQFALQDPFIQYLRRIILPLSKHEILQDRHLLDVKEAGLHFLTAVHAELVFPLTLENKFLGLLALGPRTGAKPYPAGTLEILHLLIPLAAVSIDNALLYESLSKQHAKLSEVATLKTQFASTITHELRTPLNGILGLTEVLMDFESNPNLSDDQCRYIQMIHAAGEELLEIVNHILDYTQFQSKQAPPDIRKVDLQKVLHSLTRELEEGSGAKPIHFDLELGAQTAVYGDEDQIRQLLQCLMQNAVKFSLEGRPNRISIQASRQGDMLKLGIRDHGIGIEDREQEVIFEDFRQGDGGFTRNFGGTGLGLAIAKKIVESHGGRIWVESKKGEGSQFFFTLPLKPGGLAGFSRANS